MNTHVSDTPAAALPRARHATAATAAIAATLGCTVIVAWIDVVAALNIVVPQLGDVGKTRAVSMSPNDAPSMIVTKRVGKVFHEFNTSSSVMIVVEGDKPPDPESHEFYERIVCELRGDTKHVQHVEDFWGDSLTAAGANSTDGKAAYVQVYIAGDQGEALANESVEAVQHIVASGPTPAEVKAYATGPAATTTDQNRVGDASTQVIEGATFAVITVMLLVYRSAVTTAIVLAMVVVELPEPAEWWHFSATTTSLASPHSQPTWS